MKLSTAKTVSLGLLFVAMTIGILGTALLEKGSALYDAATALIIVLMVLGIAVAGIWGRCPHCGRHLFFNLYKWKTCPECHGDLAEKTGKKK